MERLNQVKLLVEMLLDEMPNIRSQVEDVPNTLAAQRQLLRALMNIRPPMPLKSSFVALQDKLLQSEVVEKGIVTLDETIKISSNIRLWQGDITRLQVDAIVNAANSALLGCFVPGHRCIDNEIHSAAGLQLRNACAKIMQEQGHEEPTGQAKITDAFNLPSKFVIHTVGPIIPLNRQPNTDEEKLLASCYKSCLNLAVERNLKSIAFCCISTGEFHFPNRRAAEIAVDTVNQFVSNNDITVLFNTFKDIDMDIYKSTLMSAN